MAANDINASAVMRGQDRDEDQGAELPTVARPADNMPGCVPDRAVDGGNSRSVPDSLIHRLTCAQAAADWPTRSLTGVYRLVRRLGCDT